MTTETFVGHDMPPILAGCLPIISAMPVLQQLTLNLDAAGIVPQAVQQMCREGSTTLEAISFIGLDLRGTNVACGILAECPALKKIVFKLDEDCVFYPEITGLQDPYVLNNIIAQHTQLQHLELDGPVCHMTSLTCLQALTYLSTYTFEFQEDSLSPPCRPERNLQLIGSIRSLRKLAIEGCSSAMEPGWRRLCLEAVKQLPLLEDLHLPYSSWTEEELRMLLPPPLMLHKLRAGSASGPEDAESWVHVVIQMLESYNMDVEIYIKPVSS
jgi:hypothetical protein